MGCGDIVVAVLDQGLESNHPDFNNISSISFDSETGISPATIIYGNHGVAVAGVIGATTNNNLGVASVSPNVQLMSISNSLSATPLSRQNRAAGINFAWQNGASVINNSWGSTVIYQIIDDAIQDAVSLGRNGLGSVVVFASGNDNNSSIGYPSTNANTISVGAIERTPKRASFSNYGTGLDVVAPGVSITTTDRQGASGYNINGDYTTVDGTSFAAPQVAGVAALILSVNPSLTQQEVRNIIEKTTDKVGSYTYTLGAGEQASLTWNNQMGYGRVNAYAAVQSALPSISGSSTLCASQTYTISNVSSGATAVWSASPSYAVTITGSGNSRTVTTTGDYIGQVTLTAVLATACGTVETSMDIWVGGIPQDKLSIEGDVLACYGNYVYWVQNNTDIPILEYQWQLPGWGVTWQTNNYIYVDIPPYVSFPQTIEVSVRTECGWQGPWYLEVWEQSPGCADPIWPLTVSPNPADGTLTVSLADNAAGKQTQDKPVSTFSAILYDSKGSQHRKGESKGGSLQFDTRELPEGTYFLHIYLNGNI
jgi:hypothetical protein